MMQLNLKSKESSFYIIYRSVYAIVKNIEIEKCYNFFITTTDREFFNS